MTLYAVPSAKFPDATPANSITVSHVGSGAVRKAECRFTSISVALSDDAGVVAYGGVKFLDLPAGLVGILGVVADLDLTKSSAGVNDDWDGDVAIGTATATTGATLTSTEADVVSSTATPQASSGATTADLQSTSMDVLLDGTTTAKDLFLNLLVDDADHDVTTTACNLIVNGLITVTYVVLGDN